MKSSKKGVILIKKGKNQRKIEDFPFFVHEIAENSVTLRCVFHSIRFKVIKVGATAVALFFCLFL